MVCVLNGELLNWESIEDVINLARYVCSEEGGKEGFGNIRELRSLVCHCMAINVLILLINDKFKKNSGERGSVC